MAGKDRVDRHLKKVREHPVASLLIAGAILLALLEPIPRVISATWRFFVEPSHGGLEVVEARVVTDHWQAARLIGDALPFLGDSAQWASVDSFDSAQTIAAGGRLSHRSDSMAVVWFPNTAMFPEVALLDVIIRNTAPQAAAISRIHARAELIDELMVGVACLPLGMSAKYHVRLEAGQKSQKVSIDVAHRVAGNDVERIGILILQDGLGGAVYRVHLAFEHNGGEMLALPPVEVSLFKGCGTIGDPLRRPLQLKSPTPDV
jgi:hypothetical protein